MSCFDPDNDKSRSWLVVWVLLLLCFMVAMTARAQTTAGNINVIGQADFSTATHTLVWKKGVYASIPATCTVGESYFRTDGTAGQNLYGCTATNTWTQLSGGGGTGLSSGTTSGTATAYTLAASPTVGALVDKMMLVVTFHTAAGVTPTMNVDSTGSKDVWMYRSDGTLIRPGAVSMIGANTYPVIYSSGLSGSTSGGWIVMAPNPITAGTGISTSCSGAGCTWTADVSFGILTTATNTSAVMTCGSGCSQVATAATRTAPITGSTTLPGSCVIGDMYRKTDAETAAQVYLCTATNTWTQQNGRVAAGTDMVATVDGVGLTTLSADTTLQRVTDAQTQSKQYALIASGSGTTYTCNPSPAYSSLANALRAVCKVDTTSSGSATLNVNSLGAKKIFKLAGTSNASQAGSGDLRAGHVYDFTYVIDSALDAGAGVWLMNNGGSGGGSGDMILASTQTSTAKKTFSPTATDAGAAVGCAALPSSPANGDVACDSGDSNKVKVRSNGGWVPVSGGVARVAYGSLPSCTAANANMLYMLTDVSGGAKAHCDGSSFMYFVDDEPITLPPTASWTAFNSGSVAQLVTNRFQVGSADATANVRGEVRSTPGSTYTLIAKVGVALSMIVEDNPACGLMLTDGTGANKAILVGLKGDNFGHDIALGVLTFANPTSAPTQLLGTSGYSMTDKLWLKIQNNGTNRLYSVRTVGGDWYQFFSHATGTFLTETHIGWGCYTNNVSYESAVGVKAPQITLRSWDAQ